MKKIFIAFVSLFALAAMTSCDDLLEEENFGNPTIDEMVQSEKNVVLLVGQCYADLKWIHDHWGYWGLMTIVADEGICVPRNNGNDWNDGGYWLRQNTHTWDFRGDAIKNVWNSTISGAVSCNRVLEALQLAKDNISESVYAQYVGEVEVLRSYYFYLLFECFGRIPYTEKYEEVVGPMQEPWETWSNLVAVLERNAPNMAVVKDDATRTSNYGRTTQGFAYALLARLYLNAESYGCTAENVFQKVEAPASYLGSFYDNCVRCCDAIISKGSYSIESNYFTNFRIFNQNSKEIILSIVDNGLSEDSRDSWGMSNKLRLVMNTHHYGVQQAYGMALDTWNGFCARPDFLKLYNTTDVRGMGVESERNGTGDKKEWGWFVGPVYKANATAEQIAARDTNAMYLDEDCDEPTIIHSEISNINNAHNFDGARLNKWEADKTGTYTYCENDFILMRYADVLWMKEEAILRGGSGVSGINGVSKADFDAYFKRAMGSVAAFQEAYPEASTSLTAKGILDERGREFTWEMIRRRDLIRFGEYDKVQYVTKTGDYLKWFPIPKSVLEKSLRDENDAPIWTQNAGYESVK